MAFASGSAVALADYNGANPTGVPKQLAQADLVKRGEYLAHAADCVACHTAPGGAALCRRLCLQFAVSAPSIRPTSRQTNKPASAITPTQQFLDAMHKGIRADGQNLYPAMPYTSYTYMTDADALAIKAYLFTLAPVHAPAKPDKLAWPFNQRGLMAVWKYFTMPDERFRPNTRTERGMEPGRLSGGSDGPLRRVPYAAQPCLCARQPAQIRRRPHRGLARL